MNAAHQRDVRRLVASLPVNQKNLTRKPRQIPQDRDHAVRFVQAKHHTRYRSGSLSHEHFAKSREAHIITRQSSGTAPGTSTYNYSVLKTFGRSRRMKCVTIHERCLQSLTNAPSIWHTIMQKTWPSIDRPRTQWRSMPDRVYPTRNARRPAAPY